LSIDSGRVQLGVPNTRFNITAKQSKAKQSNSKAKQTNANANRSESN